MKPTYQVVLTSLKKLPALLALGCCLLANHAAAAVLYWDNNGTSTPGSGTWDTTTKNWATSSTLTTATVVWNTADAAVFTAGGTSAGSITITVNSAVPCAGMFANGVSGSACNPTFNGTGSLSIAAGLQGFFISGGFTITINVPITGAGGVEQQGGGVLSLYGNNTYTGGTEITGGQTLNYNNNNSFGTGTIIIGGNSGGLASTASTALTIPNNFSFPTPGWNLNLAGGLPVAGAPGTTFSGNFPLPTGTTTLYTGGAGQLTEISGVVGGIGATVIFSDPGTMWLAGVNTYSGNTSITNTLSGTGPNPILSIIGSGSLGSGSYSGFITNAGSFIYASSAPQTLSGVISGAGTLTVSGSGTLSLLGINTYSGATAVSAGKLAGVTGGSCAGSAVTVSSSGTLGVAITDNTKQWTCAGATFTAGTTSLDFNFNFVTPSTTLAPLNVNGAAAFTATPTVTVEAGSLPVGTYPLMTWTSTSGTAPSTVVLPPNVTGNLSLSLDGSTLLLNITATRNPWCGR